MAVAVVLAVRFAQGNFALSRTAQGMIPIALQELAAVCLGEYAATRPDTDAWIGRTLKTVLAASVPSLIWAVFWFTNNRWRISRFCWSQKDFFENL